MSNKHEGEIVDEKNVCFCSGAFPHYDLKAGTQIEQEAQTQQERILELGVDCPNCRILEPEDLIRLLNENQK